MAAATTPRFNLCICVCHPFVLPASPMGSAFNQRITPPFSHRTGSFWGKANGHHSLSLGLVGEADIRKHHRVFGRFSSPTFLVLGQAPYQEQVDFLAKFPVTPPARPLALSTACLSPFSLPSPSPAQSLWSSLACPPLLPLPSGSRSPACGGHRPDWGGGLPSGTGSSPGTHSLYAVLPHHLMPSPPPAPHRPTLRSSY